MTAVKSQVKRSYSPLWTCIMCQRDRLSIGLLKSDGRLEEPQAFLHETQNPTSPVDNEYSQDKF